MRNRLAPALSLIAPLCLLCAAPALRADTLWVASGTGRPLEMGGVKVLRVQADQLMFLNSLGGNASRPLATVVRMRIDDMPDLNAAEDAYFAEQWDQAADRYQKVITSTFAADRAWLKDWASVRLLEAANKANRFDAAVTAWLQMVVKSPETAASRKPTLPSEKSAYLPAAAEAAEKVLRDRKTSLGPAQQQMLLGFLVEVHKKRGDEKAIAELADRIRAAGGNVEDNPILRQAQVAAKLNAITAALARKEYAKVLAEAQASRELFTDRGDQVEVLWCMAEARFASLAGEDRGGLLDSALAYMRVVTWGKDLPDRKHVADALMRTAAIHERLKEPQAAIQLYQQVAREFASDPVAAQARQHEQRIRGATRG